GHLAVHRQRRAADDRLALDRPARRRRADRAIRRRHRPPPRVHHPERQGGRGDRAVLRRAWPGRRPARLTAGAHAVPPLWAPAPGRLAQLVEHLVYTERVGGSSPSPPTKQAQDSGNRSREARAPQFGVATGRRCGPGGRVASTLWAPPKAHVPSSSVPTVWGFP